jgi:HNH endonuclease
VVVLRPPRLCIYCGQEFKNVRRGEHIVPNAIGGTLTVSDVCKEKKVCQQCNTGILSDLDNELCRQSFLSVVAATELGRVD